MRRVWMMVFAVGLCTLLSACEQPKPAAPSGPAVSPEEMQKSMMKNMAPSGPPADMIEKAKAAGQIPEGTALPGEAAKEGGPAKEDAASKEEAAAEPATEEAPAVEKKE